MTLGVVLVCMWWCVSVLLSCMLYYVWCYVCGCCGGGCCVICVIVSVCIVLGLIVIEHIDIVVCVMMWCVGCV